MLTTIKYAILLIVSPEGDSYQNGKLIIGE
jgi:hypothetical protein